MLCPALFIGLGSTGLSILEEFEDLVFEHYGSPSLDVFRYVAVETREGAEVRRPTWGESKIKLLKPIISNTDAIKNMIDSGQRRYYSDWLDQRVLDISGKAFKDGATNIRMAGRLILWENWNLISQELNDAYNQITADANRNNTLVFLKKHYQKMKLNWNAGLGNTSLVYIVGTLCGGTCSGMFIDIAYYLREVSGLWARNLPNPNIARVIGLFTIFDSTILTGAQQFGLKKHAANNWSALIENNFWNHPQTRYQVTFPDGTKPGGPGGTNETPFDQLYLLSCTATNANSTLSSNFHNADGRSDEKSLNHMVALNLFTETIGELLAEKDKIRTDGRGAARAIELHNIYSPCISTFGVCAVWYPKYRVALGAAYKWGASLYEEFMQQMEPNARQIIEKVAHDKVINFLKNAESELTSTKDVNLVGDLEREFNSEKDNLLTCPASQFREQLMRKIPSLTKEGKYANHLSDNGRKINYQKKFKEEILTLLENEINNEKKITGAEYYLEKIDEELNKIIGKIPGDYPTPNFGVQNIEDDIWAKMAFKSKEVGKEQKEKVIEKFKDNMINQLKKIRNYYVRAYLEEIRQEIGIGRKLPQERIDAGEETIKQGLEKVKDSLTKCIGELKKAYEVLAKKISLTRDMKIIPFLDDIDSLAAKLNVISPIEKAGVLNQLTGGQTLSKFLGFGEKEGKREVLKEKVELELLKITLGSVQAFGVVDYIQKNFSSQELSDFTTHALPHLEQTPGETGLASMLIGRNVSFVGGANGGGLQSIRQSLVATPCEGTFQLILPSAELSHMAIFYREEPLMYMDDNLATAELFKSFYDELVNTEVYGLHTHKGGKNYFNPWIFVRREKTKNVLMPLALRIFSSKNDNGSWASSEVFSIENNRLVNRLVIRGTRRDGRTFVLTGDEQGIEFCAQEKEVFNQFNELIEKKLTEIGKSGFIKKLNAYLDWVESDAIRNERDRVEERQKAEEEITSIKMIKERFFREEEGQ